MKQPGYDVIVVGGGHAGCEAALAASRLGARTALITLTRSTIGVMSCNPAIGGLGKGHLVREIDALDGAMGRVADLAGIQFRLLNAKKGPAVQGPRAQADRQLYRSGMQHCIASAAGLDVLEGEVVDLTSHLTDITGVTLGDGTSLCAGAVVLTTGTFLRGMIHVGAESQPGGRLGERPSVKMAERLQSYGLPMGRLKTGTPPRLDGCSIDWSVVDRQPGDDSPTMFSFLSTVPSARQVDCGITQTNERTHDVVRQNLGLSAMYGGHIDGIGPRYCPSIEDKVVRFADKVSHQVFLEPEGLTDNTIYPNGISTSLPADVQDAYVRTIRGLENVRIIQPGYAIEYDFVDPRALSATLELQHQPRLFLAGQINGTTGYEEAAAQGLVAGLNAACVALGRDKIVFDRATSYIGVMIDDLTLRGVTEPYRMFTSRAEFRLSLRADNADQRLTEFGRQAGCVGDERWRVFSEKAHCLSEIRQKLQQSAYSARRIASLGIQLNPDSENRSGIDVLALADVQFTHLIELDETLTDVPIPIRQQLKRDATYATYINRQLRDIAVLKRDDGLEIPPDLDVLSLPGLSTELRLKLSKRRPATIGQAARIEGMTPSALMLILARMRTSAQARIA